MNNFNKNTVLSSKFYKVGTCIFITLGLAHFLGTLIDIITPFLFTPVDNHVKNEMIKATILITDRMSLWNAWIGFNLSHGFGVLIFGVVFLLLARNNFDYIISIKFIYPLSIFIALVYLTMSLLFWFYLPSIGCFLGLLSFIISFLLVKNEWYKKHIFD